jgi:hypothetical protein
MRSKDAVVSLPGRLEAGKNTVRAGYFGIERRGRRQRRMVVPSPRSGTRTTDPLQLYGQGLRSGDRPRSAISHPHSRALRFGGDGATYLRLIDVCPAQAKPVAEAILQTAVRSLPDGAVAPGLWRRRATAGRICGARLFTALGFSFTHSFLHTLPLPRHYLVSLCALFRSQNGVELRHCFRPDRQRLSVEFSLM